MEKREHGTHNEWKTQSTDDIQKKNENDYQDKWRQIHESNDSILIIWILSSTTAYHSLAGTITSGSLKVPFETVCFFCALEVLRMCSIRNWVRQSQGNCLKFGWKSNILDRFDFPMCSVCRFFAHIKNGLSDKFQWTYNNSTRFNIAIWC